MQTITNCPPKVEKAMKRVTKAYAKWLAAEIIDKANKQKVLNENDFRVQVERESADAKNGDRITDIIADHLMSDTDFEKYCELVYAENLKCGLDSGGVGLTLWPLRKAVLDAENDLIDTVAAEIAKKPATQKIMVNMIGDGHTKEEVEKWLYGVAIGTLYGRARK